MLFELMIEINWIIDNIRVVKMFKMLIIKNVFFMYFNLLKVFVYKEKK